MFYIFRSGQFMVLFDDVPFSLELVAFVRLFTASPEQLKYWEGLDNDKVKEDLTRKVWETKDIKALEFLEKR